MSTFHAVVWMDQAEAHVLHFDREHVESSRIRARSHHKHKGRESDQGAFFEAVSASLGGSHEVLLTGPGSAREAFSAWVKQRHPQAASLIVDSVPSDHPTDGQLVAMARKYFVRHDQLAGDPSGTN